MVNTGKIIYHYTAASLAAAATAMLMAIKEAEPPSVPNILVQLLEWKLRILAMLNLICCLVYLMILGVVRFFFGRLRATEKKQVQERMVSYLTFKVVFVGAILEPEMSELLVWVGWFLLIGLMKMLAYIAQERFHHQIDNPLATRLQWTKTVILLVVLLLVNLGWGGIAAMFFRPAGLSTVLLLLFDCFTLFVETSQALVKYSYHLAELVKQADWERKQLFLQYTDFVAELIICYFTMGHYIHIWSLNGVSFTLIDAIIILNLRGVYNKIKRKHESFNKFLQLDRHMDDMYPDAKPEELAQLPEDEVCAICLKPLLAAKKLPCGHFFHMPCLRQCLERATGTQAALCPLCRTPVSPSASSQETPPAGVGADGAAPRPHHEEPTADGSVSSVNGAPPANGEAAPQANPTRGAGLGGPPNPQPGVFRFTNDHLPRWLPVPAFSFELIHHRMDYPAGASGIHMQYPGQPFTQPAQPDESEMIAQLTDMFPGLSRNILVNEFQRDGNLAATVDRLLVLQSQMPSEQFSPPSPAITSPSASSIPALRPVDVPPPQSNIGGVLGANHQANGNADANSTDFFSRLGALFADNSTNDDASQDAQSRSTAPSSNIEASFIPIPAPSASDTPEVRRARQVQAIHRRQNQSLEN